MNQVNEKTPSRPWYKEPWPWIIISIPLASVIMGFTTLYLAITNPDHLVVEDQQYNSLKSELRAQQHSDANSEAEVVQGAGTDGAD